MIEALLLSTAVIFVAELGDKSQLMAMTFATRYRIRDVILGITAATALVHLASVGIGYFIGAGFEKDPRVEVRYDPQELGWVTLIDHRKGFTLRVPCTRPDYANGLTLHQHRVIRSVPASSRVKPSRETHYVKPGEHEYQGEFRSASF